MDVVSLAEIDAQYRQLREQCGLIDRSARGKLELRGVEAAEYMQGQLTNDIEALAVGSGLYAALLDRKARIQADMRVLRLAEDHFWLDLEPEATQAALRHLQMYKIGREVSLADVSEEQALISLVGPASGTACGVDPGRWGANRTARVHGVECVAISTAVGEVPGIDLVCPAAEAERLRAGLEEDGIPEVSEEAYEILRIEAGVPRFGREISTAWMPAEAGIVERAINFEKGCYIGQEPVARLHYRGRPNRTLRRLSLSAAVGPGTPLWLGEKQVGEISSSAISPASGPIALAIVRREAEPGARLEVGEGEAEAEVLAPVEVSGS